MNLFVRRGRALLPSYKVFANTVWAACQRKPECGLCIAVLCCQGHKIYGFFGNHLHGGVLEQNWAGRINSRCGQCQLQKAVSKFRIPAPGSSLRNHQGTRGIQSYSLSGTKEQEVEEEVKVMKRRGFGKKSPMCFAFCLVLSSWHGSLSCPEGTIWSLALAVKVHISQNVTPCSQITEQHIYAGIVKTTFRFRIVFPIWKLLQKCDCILWRFEKLEVER